MVGQLNMLFPICLNFFFMVLKDGKVEIGSERGNGADAKDSGGLQSLI